jgi:hypothetical protein
LVVGTYSTLSGKTGFLSLPNKGSLHAIEQELESKTHQQQICYRSAYSAYVLQAASETVRVEPEADF